MMSAAPQPLVSVVIPTYRRTAYLGEAIASVLAQTVTDVEVVVVEDGSCEARDVATRFGPRVRYAWQPNQGVSVARNTGVALSRGPWIAFLDDDDLWEPTKLQAQLDLVQREPTFGLVHTDHLRLLAPFGQPRPSARRSAVPSGDVLAELFQHNFVITSSVLLRRELFDRVGGFDPRFRIAQDYHLWLRLAAVTRFGFCAEPLTVYRVHGHGLSDARAAQAREDCQILEEIAWKFAHLGLLGPPWAVRRRLHDAHRNAARLLLWNDDFAQARRYFLAAWRWQRRDLPLLGYVAVLGGPRRCLEWARAAKRLAARTVGHVP